MDSFEFTPPPLGGRTVQFRHYQWGLGIHIILESVKIPSVSTVKNNDYGYLARVSRHYFEVVFIKESLLLSHPTI